MRSNRSSIGGGGPSTTKSRISTLTKEELQKFFKDKKTQMEEDAKSKMSQITRGTFKSYKLKKDRAENIKITEGDESP